MRLSHPGIFLLILSGMLGAVVPTAAQRGANPPLPTPQIPDSLGVNIHFNDPRPGEMEQLAAEGFRWIRQDFAWAGIERAKGQYDFSAYERLLAALEPHHIRPIFILDYGNDLYEQGSPRTPESRAAFARFAAAAVSHFKNRGILWEMWNEPNGGFWQPKANVDEYIALALETGKAIRQAAPNEWYIGPGVSGMDFGFMERCFRAGLLRYWDAVSFHPYRNTPPETAAPDYRRLREIVARYAPAGKVVPILSSEWGYSELYPGLNLEKQTRYIVREYLTNLMNGLLLSIWYDWHDDGTDPKETEHHFGTVYNDYRPKPTYAAAQTLATQLKGFHYNKRLALDSPDDYCLLFADRNSHQRLVAWTTDAKPHEVKIPASAGLFHVVSLFGIDAPAQAGADGLSLTLTDAPQYLIPQSSNRLLALAAAWHTAPAVIYAEQGIDDALVFLPFVEGDFPSKAPPLPVQLTLRNVSRPGALQPAHEIKAASTFSVPMFDRLLRMDSTMDPIVSRSASPLVLRVTIQFKGVGQAAQEFEVRPRHPLHVTPLPAVGTTLPVRVENPTGAPFTGRIGLAHTAKPAMLPVRFAAGETEKTVTLPFPAGGVREYRVACSVQELQHSPARWVGVALQRNGVGHAALQKGRTDWVTVVTTPTLRFTPFETFAAYPIGAPPPASDYQIVPDGDPKVKSDIGETVVEAPAGLPGAAGHALQIAYRFDPGWKFLRLARNTELPGAPEAFGMWVYGDGSGDALRMRFTDATGQTFQPDGGNVDWKGWRYLSFPLQGDVGGHWGGANDGTIHYPIRLDTPFLVDSPDRRGGRGSLYLADLTLISRD